MTDRPARAFATRAVHAGERLSSGDFTPVASPIHPSVSYLSASAAQADAVFAGTKEGYVYSRYGNPTVAAFEAAVSDLETAEAAQAYSSGMAAVHGALLAAGVRAGSGVVAALDLYGATFSLVRSLMAELGVRVELVDVTDLAAVEAAVDHLRPAVLVVETISNPLLKVADLPTLAKIAHRAEAKLLVDNTFATPYLCRPLTYGADFVIHSASKYLAGHGDVLAGAVAASSENRQKLNELNKLVGGILGPFEAWLALRGLKTLPLRMRQQSENAARLAVWLSGHPRLGRVNYPGLPSHPQHSIAGRLFEGKGYGGMISFEINGAGRESAFRFMDALQLCLPATTLGDIYTLVLHPASSSHRSLSEAERRKVGISEGLIRLSAGIEAVEDLFADLEQALAQL